MTTRQLNIGSFFAGVGGIDLGFEKAGFKVAYANEIDPYPVQTYNLNFNISADNRDICEVLAKEIPDFDILVGGFPCQAFSVAGYREGFDDKKGRGTLFFEIIRIIKEKKQLGKQPSIVFLENVKNLKTHDNGNTFKVINATLKQLGYVVKSADLISQDKLDDSLYYTKNFKQFDELKKYIKSKETLYQWRRQYVRENKSNLCPTLTANMGTGGHNVPLVLTDNGIRKLTPKECFLFQGFPNDFKLPTIGASRLYKQAGNSVVVSVIQKIASEIKKALNQ